jgi:hypothetical protein
MSLLTQITPPSPVPPVGSFFPSSVSNSSKQLVGSERKNFNSFGKRSEEGVKKLELAKK